MPGLHYISTIYVGRSLQYMAELEKKLPKSSANSAGGSIAIDGHGGGLNFTNMGNIAGHVKLPSR